ncbi:efflux RND transporter periplasmic adaptor subunit [Roseixanthobacter glucoisosaccharinicivorans]|uniref:efflux RND transporter periplasmic adaptor subunit n=1 Tax=Roseixanthobacter glucoisosaccharinicivorans TaxID=3119923 RepID=UPI00372BC15B
MPRLVWVVTPAILVAGALAWHYGFAAPASPQANAKKAPPPIPVLAGPVREQNFPVYATGLGTVQAFNSVTVKVRVDGELDKVTFTEGQDVKAGDVLAQIDPRPFQATLAQAQAAKAKDQAQLANAKLDQDRFKQLVTKNAVSQQQLDTQNALVAQYEAAIQGDDAAIDSANVQLGYTTVRAPISGRTGVRLVDEGNIVHAADTTGLVVITQLKPISVIISLPQDRRDDVVTAMGQGPVTVLAFRRDGVTQLGAGTVTLIDNQIDQSTGTIRIKATFPNEDLKLWPGAFVNAQVLVDTRKDAILVPAQVVQRGPDGFYVYVVRDDDTVEKRAVTVGPSRAGQMVVETGLTAGERVVVDGQYKLTPGAHVSVSAAPDAKPQAAPLSTASAEKRA